jgi:hypothetical protein
MLIQFSEIEASGILGYKIYACFLTAEDVKIHGSCI